jgi:glycosyltransferase involved in cell wall biosynthesis
MKICHIMTRFIRGGADENVLFSCNGQAAAGHEVHFLFGDDAHDGMVEALSDAVHWKQISRMRRSINPINDLLALLEIHRYLQHHRFDIVHTHASKAGVLGRVAAYLARTPVVIHGIHILPFINVGAVERVAYLLIERRMAKVTDAFISVGQGMRDEALANGVGKPKQHYLIESGMDIGRFHDLIDKRLDWRAVLDPETVAPVELGEPRFILLVSRFEARKRQYEFLEVFADILEAAPNVRLLLAGEGPDADRLSARISELKLEGKAIMTGFRADVERLMAIAEVGLLTSEREGLARVLVQYALSRLPIVSTDIPGVREIVTPGKTGLLVPAYALDEMTASVLLLLNDSARREAMRSSLGQMDLNRWSVAEMNAKILELYQAYNQTR